MGWFGWTSESGDNSGRWSGTTNKGQDNETWQENVKVEHEDGSSSHSWINGDGGHGHIGDVEEAPNTTYKSD